MTKSTPPQKRHWLDGTATESEILTGAALTIIAVLTLAAILARLLT